MKLKCPHCEVESDFPDEGAGPFECPFCGESFQVTPRPVAMPSYGASGGPPAEANVAGIHGTAGDLSSQGGIGAASASAVCPICCTAIAPGDAVTVCPDCKTPHHAECWSENHGCSTYGCASAAHQETHTTDGGGAGAVPGGATTESGIIACPACGAMHPSTDLVCSSCGKLLGDGLPHASLATQMRNTAKRFGQTAKADLGPCLGRNFRLLGLDIAAVFRLWWGEFSRYAAFTGVTSRKGFISFTGVNFVVSRILLMTGARLLAIIFVLATLLPSIAVAVRRLRDTWINPWIIFALPLVPFLLLVPTVTEDGRPTR